MLPDEKILPGIAGEGSCLKNMAAVRAPAPANPGPALPAPARRAKKKPPREARAGCSICSSYNSEA